MAILRAYNKILKVKTVVLAYSKGFIRPGRESIELAKGLLYLSPFIGMLFLEEEQPGSGLLFLRQYLSPVPRGSLASVPEQGRMGQVSRTLAFLPLWH